MATLKVAVIMLITVAVYGADERSAAVDKVFEAFSKPDSPGCAVAIVQDGRVVHSKAYGLASLEHEVPLTTSSVFMISSTTKQFTGFAVQLLRSRGKLSLDDSVRKYIPELPASFGAMTLNHLLHHTSGIPQYSALRALGLSLPPLPSPQDLVQALSRLRSLNFELGEEYGYSNEDYTLLGIVVSRVTGMPLSEFARREIFEPLGMNSTLYMDSAAPVIKHRATNYARKSDGTFELSSEEWLGNAAGTSERVPDGGIGVLSTVEDFIRWDLNFTEAKLGGREVFDAMEVDGTLNTGQPVGYGSGLVLGNYRGLRTVGHTGLGHGNRSLYMRFPDQRLSVVVLCNLPDVSRIPDRLYEIYLKDQLKDAASPKESAPPPALISLSAGQLERFEGTYWNKPRRAIVRVYVSGGGLRVSSETSGDSLWRPVSESEFRRETNLQDRIVFQGNRLLNPAVWEKVDLVSPSGDALSEYSGDWYSPDLDVKYQFAVKDGRLHWSQPANASGYDLTQFVRDQFHSSSADFEFKRNSSGKIVELDVSLSRARNIKFERVDARH